MGRMITVCLQLDGEKCRFLENIRNVETTNHTGEYYLYIYSMDDVEIFPLKSIKNWSAYVVMTKEEMEGGVNKE